jgi:hypothetical protein
VEAQYYKLVIENEWGAEIFSSVLLPETRIYSAPASLLDRQQPAVWSGKVLAFSRDGAVINSTGPRVLRILPNLLSEPPGSALTGHSASRMLLSHA